MAEWSEQWALGAGGTGATAITGPSLYGEQTVEVVPKQEAEQKIEEAQEDTDRAEAHCAAAERQRDDAEIKLDQALQQGAEQRDEWATLAGIGFDIARAAQRLLGSVRPADGKSDPATVSRESITGLQAALRRAEPEEGTPIDAARSQGAEGERERIKKIVRVFYATRSVSVQVENDLLAAIDQEDSSE